MKNIKPTSSDVHANEINEGQTRKEILSKSDQEIKSQTQTFFQNFSQRYRDQTLTYDKKNDGDKLFLEEIKDMDNNTAFEPTISYEVGAASLTYEELQQLDENDPGYVKENVLDFDNDLNTEENRYNETGLHTGAIRWGDYAAKEGKEYRILETGVILSRWGDGEGTFMSDVDAEYKSLELPIVEEKNRQGLYEVLKPFPVEVSKIAKQPWNEISNSEENGNTSEAAIQYRTPIPICNLIQEGYLKKVDFGK